MCLLPNLALFSGLCASLIFFHNPFPICSHFLMNCHLSHSIKSALCENFSKDGRTEEGKRQPEQAMGKNEGKTRRGGWGRAGQGGGDRDVPAGLGTVSDLHGQMNHSMSAVLGSLAPKQGTNNHIRPGRRQFLHCAMSGWV